MKKYKCERNGTVINIKTGRVLKPCINHGGYYSIIICEEKQHRKYIHRLVAETYIPNPFNLPEVNHKDGDKSNNNDWNLEWCTAKENTTHAINTGLKSSVGINNKMAKLTEKQVLEIRSLKGIITQKQIANKFHVSQSMVSMIQTNTQWKHI